MAAVGSRLCCGSFPGLFTTDFLFRGCVDSVFFSWGFFLTLRPSQTGEVLPGWGCSAEYARTLCQAEVEHVRRYVVDVLSCLPGMFQWEDESMEEMVTKYAGSYSAVI